MFVIVTLDRGSRRPRFIRTVVDWFYISLITHSAFSQLLFCARLTEDSSNFPIYFMIAIQLILGRILIDFGSSVLIPQIFFKLVRSTKNDLILTLNVSV